MTPQDYYNQKITCYSQQLKRIKKQRNLITLAKLLTFAALIFQIYWLITTHTFPVAWTIVCVILFIFLTQLDQRIVKQQKLLEELISINKQETDYLSGSLSSFATGQVYLDPTHPYAGDLDLFGEDSLFQHLNRTATSAGTHKLADWLLTLSKEPETIRQRQEAVTELSELPEWCHYFRALGKLHPTQEIDSSILRQWQEQPAFFKNAQRTRTILYLTNSIILMSWILVAVGLFPYGLALIFSLLQLLVLALFLKKINLYHNQLNRFIRTISNYLPLIRQLEQQSFHSAYLQNIKNILLKSSCNALKALSALNKIQERLDQRGNVLTAFVLNGLYLKDMHIILSMDKWKKTYSSNIDTWTTATSETDALVSMANYRYNHPDYTFPILNDSILLDAREAGHPLLKGKYKVTNDFRVDHLHQLYIVTGANMAGKSTFLRTIGVNLVLAQSGNVVYSSQFTFHPMALFTSMRTTDNLAKDTSYFHAELLRLKQLIEIAEQEEKLFIILDEMLKGTNSVDKLNGSLAFLRKLLSYPVSGLVATHDLALGDLATSYPANFLNTCFEITHTGNDISYDYKLHPGVSSTMNASILLKQMGLI